MVERTPFTPGMKDVMRFSRAEAVRLNHDHIGPEHYLLGIIRKGDGMALQVLQNLDVDLEDLKVSIEKATGTGPGAPPLGIYNPTLEAKQVIEGAREIAQKLKHSWIGTEHLLLSLIRAENTEASKCLREWGITYEGAQREILAVIDRLSSSPETKEPQTPPTAGPVEPLRQIVWRAPEEPARSGLRRLLTWPGRWVRRQAMRAIGSDFFARQQAQLDAIVARFEQIADKQRADHKRLLGLVGESLREIRTGLEQLTAHTGTLTENVRNLNRDLAGEQSPGRLRQDLDEIQGHLARVLQQTDAVWGSLDRMHGFVDEERKMLGRFSPFFELSRGPEQAIRDQQAMYVPEFAGKSAVVDLGCGRGEFLDLLRGAGIDAEGVDIDAELVAKARAKGHRVHQADLLDWLVAQPDASRDGIFCAQVVEHFPLPTVDRLVAHAARVLVPDGRLVLETLNPTSLNIFMGPHWADPSHRQPIHPWTLSVMCQTRGFMENRVVFSAPPPPEMLLPPLDREGAPEAMLPTIERLNRIIAQLNDSLYGPGQYAVISRRGRPEEFSPRAT
jgi:SAM-dependent methyltransferase